MKAKENAFIVLFHIYSTTSIPTSFRLAVQFYTLYGNEDESQGKTKYKRKNQ